MLSKQDPESRRRAAKLLTVLDMPADDANIDRLIDNTLADLEGRPRPYPPGPLAEVRARLAVLLRLNH